MAYAAYSEFLGSPLPPLRRPHRPSFVVMDITVPSHDAWRVRRALAQCPGAGILRCVPKPHEHLVHLEVHLPAGREPDVMHCVLGCVPCGQIGAVYGWDEHLTRHGLAHGH